MVAGPLILPCRDNKKVGGYSKQAKGDFWMVHRSSSKAAKSRHAEKQQIRNILLTYSFKDRLAAETVYTPENEKVVLTEMQAKLGFTQFVAEYGEVLTSPLGESPTVQALGA